jgi:hypothetical protein
MERETGKMAVAAETVNGLDLKIQQFFLFCTNINLKFAHA